MALSIGIKPGSTIIIGGTHTLKVTQVISHNKVKLTFDDVPYVVTDLERSELMPRVYVQCGLTSKTTSSQYSRLAFEAPRDIRIERAS